MTIPNRLCGLAALASIGLIMSGCNALDRLANVGREPQFDPIINPTQEPQYAPVNMPMPAPIEPVNTANSLWQPGARAFFKDQRAARVGDILTVEIMIEDKAELKNETTRSRENEETAAIGALFGYEQTLHTILPEAVVNTDLLDLDSSMENTGGGEISRDESIELKVAAVIIQVLPNGNLVIDGDQQVRVNYEMRELQIYGVIRPEDIAANNTISYEKIANARIAYGGEGHISDVQQPRYGSQVLDVINPF